MYERESVVAYRALRVAFGVVPIVAGLDKFLNLLADWPAYLSPWIARLLPVSPEVFMRLSGVVEIAVGAAILLGFARVFGFIASAWIALIALQLLTTGRYYDVAARDAVMAVAAFALGRLATAVEPARVRASRPAAPGEAATVRG